jgi:hypothetical protein
MTDESTIDDGIDSEDTRGGDRPENAAGDMDRRSFMKGTAASAAALGGLAASSGAASASGGSNKHLLVAGRGYGEHTYTVVMRQGGSIQKANFAGPNDSVTSNNGSQRAEGELWHWNVDSYTYSGEIDRVECDGTVSVHFPDGAFGNEGRIVVGGNGSGTHNFSLATAGGDIEPVEKTTEGGNDSDDLPSSSERSYKPDQVSGRLTDDGADTFTFGNGDSLQNIRVDGQVEVNPYRVGRTVNASNGKEASIVYFYMGDGDFTTFFQNFTAVYEAMKGYDTSYLLKHDNQSSGLSQKAHNMADVVNKPTKDNFEHCVRALAEQGYTTDLYIISHGWRDSFKLSTGTHGSEDWYSYADIERLRASFSGQIPLRMVYQCNCWGSELNGAWRKLGATAAVGPRFVNFWPNQFEDFCKRWRNGDTLQQALSNANTATSRSAVKTYIEGDIWATQGDEWGDESPACTPIAVLQGTGDCAQDYFTNRWHHTDAEWNSVTKDGWDFMHYASEKLVAGNDSIKR